jgi:conjugative relaxase-like TrwC/TraI family protein
VLSITKINSSHNQQRRSSSSKEGGYLFYLGSPSTHQRTDFIDYVKGHEALNCPAPFWAGRGVQELKLGPTVLQADVEQLAHGFSPSGTPLVRGAGNDHVMGADLTFNAPKDVSAVFAAADPGLQTAINACMQEAVLAGLDYSESISVTRHGKAGRVKKFAQAVVAACYPHFASRAIQPQLHVHAFLFNLAKRSGSEEWSALDHKAQFDHKSITGMLFRVDLAYRLAGLGFEILPDRQYFKINGITEHQRKSLSLRSQEIKDYLAATGTEGPAAAAIAALNTRSAKAEPAYLDLIEHFKSMVEKLDLTSQQVQAMRNHHAVRSEPFTISHEELLSELTQQHSAVTLQEALHLICKKSMGQWSAAQCRAHLEQFLNYSEVLRLGNTEHLTQVITSREMYEREQAISQRVAEGVHDARFHLSTTRTTAAFDLLEKDLSNRLGVAVDLSEQRKAAEYICSGSGNHAFVQGWAGTGKTTLLKAVAEIYRAAGFTVIGACQSASAAQNLARETGIPSSTIARLRLSASKGHVKFNERTILILDEAGLIGSREFDLLQTEMLSRGRGGKMICVGDVLQHSSIEAGGIIKLLMEKYGYAEISNIQRQRTDFEPLYALLSGHAACQKTPLAKDQIHALKALPERERSRAIDQLAKQYPLLAPVIRSWQEQYDYQWLRSVVKDFANGNALPALQAMEEKGRLKFQADAKASMNTLIQAWQADPQALTEKIIIAGLRDEVHQLNQLAREQLIADHRIDARQSMTLNIRYGEEGQGQRDFAPGDRLVFTKNNAELGVLNGTTGTLTSIRNTETLMVRLDLPNEQGQTQLTIPIGFAYFDHAYSLTTYKSQGRTFNSAHVYMNPAIAGREWSYVAASRSRFATTFYVPTDSLDLPESENMLHHIPEPVARKHTIEQLAQRVARKNSKLTTLDYVSSEFAFISAPSEQLAQIVKQSHWLQEKWASIADRFLQRLRHTKTKELEYSP